MPDKILTGVTLADLERERLAFATLAEAACILRVLCRSDIELRGPSWGYAAW